MRFLDWFWIRFLDWFWSEFRRIFLDWFLNIIPFINPSFLIKLFIYIGKIHREYSLISTIEPFLLGFETKHRFQHFTNFSYAVRIIAARFVTIIEIRSE